MSAYTVRTERIAIGRPRTVIWWELTSITVETERHHTTTDDKTVEGHCFLAMTIRFFFCEESHVIHGMNKSSSLAKDTSREF